MEDNYFGTQGFHLGVIASGHKSKINIACIGDSITYGLLLEYREDDSYPNRLQMLLGDEHYVVHTDLGESGASVWSESHYPYTSTGKYNVARQYDADIQVICLGTNDTQYYGYTEFRKGFVNDYVALIDHLKENSPTSKTYICMIPPIFGYEPLPKAVPEINKMICQIPTLRDVEIINLNAPLEGRDDLFVDGVHPNAAGARLIAEIIFNAITKNI